MQHRAFLNRLLITGAAIMAYHWCHQIPVPALAPGAYAAMESLPQSIPGLSIVALSLTPFFIGFLVVELLSFLPFWKMKYRQGGIEGRKKLNGLAIRFSLAVALLQGLGLSLGLEAMRFPGGLPILQAGLAPRMIAILTWVAGSFALFGLCQFISRRGLGNGFCVVIAVDLIYELSSPWSLEFHRSDPAWAEHFTRFALLAAVTAAASVYVFLRRPTSETSYRGEPGADLSLPSFPQGLVPLMWAPSLLLLPAALGPILGAEVGFGSFSFGSYLPSLGVLVLTLCPLTAQLFATRKRIEANVPGLSLASGFEIAHAKALVATSALLIFLAVAWAALDHFAFGFGLTAVPIVVLAAVATDLVSEWRFRRFHRTAVRWIELDNVHLASYVSGLLRQESVPFVVQAFHFRSLFFFLSPLEKMAILVPEENLGQADDLFSPLETPTV